VVRTGGRAKKSSAGYDLTRLFVGSEGTLGIVTEVTVRLYPVPEAMSAAVCNFPSLADAVSAVIETIQLGVPIARCEFLDEVSIRAINAYSKTTLREAPTLFFEFHGSQASAREQAETVQEVARTHGGQDFEWATQPEDRTRLWNARHTAYFAALQLRPGCRAVTTDTCVPISRLAESIVGARRILDRAPCPTAILGHVGDGNFHAVLLIDPSDPKEVELAEELNDEIVRLAISMGGTCTGEHGIGLHKIGYLVEEAGDDAIDLMRRIKRALDPDGLMNPGKIFRS
jgi:D-lactate dehydrogenase (cytochrome)